MARIIETVGSIDVEPGDGGLWINQPDITGGGQHSAVFVPWGLVNALCKAIRDEQKAYYAGSGHGR